MFSVLWKTAVISAAASTAALAGCVDQEAPCEVQSGTYHIQLPDNPSEKTPTIMFLHGYGSSGQATMGNKRIVEPFLKRGYAVIAPNALLRKGRKARAWNFHPDFHRERDEASFFKDVKQDAIRRFDLDEDNMLLAGFSIGGSMTAYVGCNNPDLFKAYAPVSGNFWRPYPTECIAPVKLFHTHGWRVNVNGTPSNGELFVAVI